MKILYDHQTFTLQNYGGISRYFFELYSRSSSHGVNVEIPKILSNNAYLNSNTDSNVIGYFPKTEFPGKYRIQKFINQQSSIYEIKHSNFDVLHPTYYDPYFLKCIGNKPFVITFLDMIHEKFGSKYNELGQDKVLFNNKKILLEKAAKVIAISDSTKKDIMDIFNTSGENIEVIYLGNSLVLDNSKNGALRVVEEPYLLFVGNRAAYKNFSVYLEAVSDILKQRGIKLVCAGGGNFSETEQSLIRTLGVSNLVTYVAINDEILQNLYSNAEAFAFPSHYEGFGIPILEAFACNCVCLLSNGGSLPEVGGDAAIYYDPNSQDQMRFSLLKILDDDALKEKLIKSGQERLKLFSWKATVNQTIDLYKSLI